MLRRQASEKPQGRKPPPATPGCQPRSRPSRHRTAFADEEYYGVDAFVFVIAVGKRQAVRYQMVPERVVHLDPAEAAKRPPDFLIDE
jgi:hypothetical protein